MKKKVINAPVIFDQISTYAKKELEEENDQEENVMGFCMNCSTEIPDEAKFCPKCGAPLVGSASKADMKETEGGYENDSQQDFFNQQNIRYTPEKKKRKILPVIIAIVVILVACVLGLFVIRNAGTQTVNYEGISFRVPKTWEYDKDSSSDGGLYFKKENDNEKHMLYFMHSDDYSSLIGDYFDTEDIMDYLVESFEDYLGGEAGDASKTKVAGYSAYVYDVKNAELDDSVKGGYRLTIIINDKENEMICLCEAEASKNGKATATDMDRILKSARVTDKKNTYKEED